FAFPLPGQAHRRPSKGMTSRRTETHRGGTRLDAPRAAAWIVAIYIGVIKSLMPPTSLC
ncbi:MAG: hypothetical protein QOI50_7631, partial [Pseudonocardiales bacterium]|nr:hypothetical protein [Pseudonocardiales bacterium]